MNEGLATRHERFIYLREVTMPARRAEGTGQKVVAAEPPRPWIYLRVAR